MFSFFESVVSLVGLVIDYVISIFVVLINLFSEMINSVMFIGTALFYLPSYIVLPLISLFVIVVLLNILNKGS